MASIRAGRPPGAAALFERYHGHVRRVLVRVMGPDAEIADLIQDTFVAAIGSIDKLQSPEAVAGWLSSIAIFTARARIRQRKRRRFLLFLPSEELPDVSAPENLPEVDDAVRATYRVLDSLPADERIAFALRYIEGMETAEVAQGCGVSLATAKRRIARAQARFSRLAAREKALEGFLEGGPVWTR